MKLTEVNSNLIFLVPVITSFVTGEKIYCFLSVSILCASFTYHYAKDTKKNIRTVVSLQWTDRIVAVLSYMYMFYFLFVKANSLQVLFSLALFITIILYLISVRQYKNNPNVHSYFHIAIGIVSGLIPLLS